MYIFSSFLLVVNPSFGQLDEISFKHLSTVDGLSNFTVLSIVQDHNGFMWFGTMDGLNRFDGRQIKIYRHKPDDPYSLDNSFIHSILCDGDSGLWIGSNNGLYYYRHRYDNFQSVPLFDSLNVIHQNVLVKSLLIDKEILWIGTDKGLYRYHLINKKFIPFGKNKNSLSKPLGFVQAFVKDKNGKLWIGGNHGLFTFEEEKFVEVDLNMDSELAESLTIISINIDSMGKVWLGTLGFQQGLIVYDPVIGSSVELTKEDGYIPNNKVNCIFPFEGGKMWVGTTWGLSIIDEQTLTSKFLFYDGGDPRSLSQNSIKSIYQGKNGIIWVSTYSGGINYFDPKSQKISHITNKKGGTRSLNFNIVSTIYEDKDKNVWIGTEYGGVNLFKQDDKTIEIIRKEDSDNSLIGDNIKSIIQDHSGRMVIATIFGLSILDKEKDSFINISDEPGERGFLSNRTVHDLCMDKMGNIWLGILGQNSHMQVYDPHQDTIIHYYPENADFPVLSRIGVNSMVYDLDRELIWAGGNNGLLGFDTNSRTYLTDSTLLPAASELNGTIINDLFIGENQYMWIATFGQGLYLMDLQTFRLRKIHRQEGLEASSYYAITDDIDGNIWLSANAYLIKIKVPNEFDAPIEKVEQYSIQEGFPPQQYFRNAASRGSNGILYFGGDDGLISFNPAEIAKIVVHPDVAITGITVNGSPFQVRDESNDQLLNVSSLNEIFLTYEQSSFAVAFIAPNFINPQNTWYQYQLSDIHDSWQELGNTNTINFTKLKAGSYVLKIRASSDPDNFHENFSSIILNVSPPYWGTPLAYVIYLLIILISLYLLFVISRKWERLNQNLKFEYLQREQEKEFNQKRIKFFTDISHELRTPLTLILAPLERIVKSNFGNAKIKNQLMLMLRNGDRMLQLINQLLDLRKLETGHMRLQAAKGNIVRFVKEASLSFRELANDRNIDFKLNSSNDKITLWFDRDKLEIILFNLLSNAIKYTPDHGSITINIDEFDGNENDQNESGFVNIRIENTGKGIETEHLDSIFERFYSGEKSNKHKKYSSGVGLEIVKNLVELHKGSISVESQFNEDGIHGQTTFILCMKKGKQHLSKDEILMIYKNSEDIANYEVLKSELELNSSKQTNSPISPKVSESKDESVLIVEDNPDVRELVVNIFNDVYNIFEASNGEEGLNIAQEKMPDLIISDIMMPVMDGIELCRKIKTDVNTSHIPVILLTARTAVTFKYEGLETGADDYIVKPFNVEDLRLRATNLIKQRKLLKKRFEQSGLLIPTEISITSVDERLLQNTIDYVIDNIDDASLTVDRIAREIGMSRTNFYRKIKALTNLSASEFLRTIRMNHAAELLKTNKLRISEVATMVGITDNDYFRECFKKQFGLTPTAFLSSQEKSHGYT